MGLLRALRNYKAWDDYWYGPVVHPTASGVDVTPETALGQTALWNGVTLIANALSVVPLRLYRRKRGGGREEAREDPRFRIVNRKPNRWMTSFGWRHMSQGHLLLRGNSYAQKVYRTGGPLDSLVPLHPTRMEVFVDGADVFYEYKRDDGTKRVFEAKEVLHIRGLSTNGIIGFCPITVLRESLGSMMATDLYAARYFKNDARPAGALKVPRKLDDPAYKRLKTEWQAAHSEENQHTVAILDNGMEWQSIGFSAEDAQLIASRTFNVQEAARALNIPPHKLKELSRATFSNIEEQNIEWVIDTVQPWAENWEQQLDADLLTEREQSTLFFKFDLLGLLRGDSARRAVYMQARFNMGSLSPNEVRALDDENPIEGGDRYYLQRNLMPLDMIDELLEAEAKPAPPAEESVDQDVAVAQLRSFTPLVRDLAARLLHREITAAKRAARKQDWTQFRVWIDEFYAESVDAAAQQFVPLAASMAQAAGCTGPNSAQAVRSFVAAAADALNADSLAALKDLLRVTPPESMEAALDQMLESWRWSRPDAVAEREVARAAEMFTVKLLGAA